MDSYEVLAGWRTRQRLNTALSLLGASRNNSPAGLIVVKASYSAGFVTRAFLDPVAQYYSFNNSRGPTR
ncbi:hypothetical protein OKW29_002242 [Paraburkholderia sp. CI3]